MLDYMDSIMDVDSGDIGLWIACEHGNCQYLTRGIKTQRNKIALAKALLSGCAVAFSFVDTPKENMTYNLEQLQKTLDVVDAVPERVGNPEIIHLHLKSGPSVNPSVFRDFKIEDAVIYALGRANDFAYDEVDHYPDREFTAPTLIEPNGNITIQEIKNGEISKKIMGNLFKYQNGPKINPVRLFIRQKIFIIFPDIAPAFLYDILFLKVILNSRYQTVNCVLFCTDIYFQTIFLCSFRSNRSDTCNRNTFNQRTVFTN